MPGAAVYIGYLKSLDSLRYLTMSNIHLHFWKWFAFPSSCWRKFLSVVEFARSLITHATKLDHPGQLLFTILIPARRSEAFVNRLINCLHKASYSYVVLARIQVPGTILTNIPSTPRCILLRVHKITLQGYSSGQWETHGKECCLLTFVCSSRSTGDSSRVRRSAVPTSPQLLWLLLPRSASHGNDCCCIVAENCLAVQWLLIVAPSFLLEALLSGKQPAWVSKMFQHMLEFNFWRSYAAVPVRQSRKRSHDCNPSDKAYKSFCLTKSSCWKKAWGKRPWGRRLACSAPELAAVFSAARPEAAETPSEKRAALPTVTVSDSRRRPLLDPQFLMTMEELLISASRK